MSEPRPISEPRASRTESDPRVARTRKAVTDTFVRLVHERSYDSISVGSVLEAAEVGRATFYSHYRNKDDLLVQSVAIVMDSLAERFGGLLRDPRDLAPLEGLLAHFLENRELWHRLTTGPAAPVFAHNVDRLAERMEAELERYCRDSGRASRVPTAVIARAMADGYVGFLRGWLDGEAEPCPPPALSNALRSFTSAAIQSLLPAANVRA